MLPLVTPLTDFIVLGQNPIHRPPVTEIDPFIQQGGIHFPWRLIHELLAVEDLPHPGFLGLA
jgi:hypothetical protein